MSARVKLTVQKGSLSGQSFAYDEKESILMGRQDNCGIVLPDSTVSRYHCLLFITPPKVLVRDLKSENGTYINGEKIDSIVDFSMKSGDRLGLGKDCEFIFEVESSETDVDNSCEISERVQTGEQCCGICGKPLSEEDASDICETCKENPMDVLAFLKERAEKNTEAKEIAGYWKIKLLGQGGMGQTWLAEDEKTGKLMALKLMHPKAAANKRSRDLFLREAYYAEQLNHKNIVKQWKCDKSNNRYYILMEYCNAGSVDKFIERSGGKLSVALATDIILQVLDGLIYAHTAPVISQRNDGETRTVSGIVHRDIKPGNILLSDNGKILTAKIADFGLAKAFEKTGLSGGTRTGHLSGTPFFMPRQQIINYKHAGPAVDVWAVAASYYFMLTGALTKDYVTGKDIIATALGNVAVPIRDRNTYISARLAEVIDYALMEIPEIGVQSAVELKKMIEGAL